CRLAGHRRPRAREGQEPARRRPRARQGDGSRRLRSRGPSRVPGKVSMATLTPTRPPVFNLPNQLTAARLVLALVLFALIAWENWIGCILVFAVAALTDWLDGYFARKQGLISTLGRNLDPLVDKVLICGAYIFLLPFGLADAWDVWLLPWMVTVVVARELIITSL